MVIRKITGETVKADRGEREIRERKRRGREINQARGREEVNTREHGNTSKV